MISYVNTPVGYFELEPRDLDTIQIHSRAGHHLTLRTVPYKFAGELKKVDGKWELKRERVLNTPSVRRWGSKTKPSQSAWLDLSNQAEFAGIAWAEANSTLIEQSSIEGLENLIEDNARLIRSAESELAELREKRTRLVAQLQSQAENQKARAE